MSTMPPAPHDARAQLLMVLRDENSTVRLLEATLREEAEALLAGERARIEEIAGRKQHQLNHLAGLDRERRQWWATYYPMDDPYGLPRFIQADAELAAVFNDTIARTRQLQNANEANGAIIDLRLRTARDALTVLGSAVGGQQPYGPDGRQPLKLPGFSVVAR
ncbi:flagellar protein FlgN [Imbroritus primus]|uniref:Flagellar protein FlgN n=1 Tax=Imbroritus primus TaxID=3058603 RepID=A0ACD3SUX6_9BURK|nr:flagellar protein FlgN [Burkholderiaceae bacterium PBA]